MGNYKSWMSYKVRLLKLKLRQFLLGKLGSNARYVASSSDEGLFLVDPLDNHVSRQILKTGRYNPGEVDFLSSYIRNDDRLLVVGAHIGALVVPLSNICASLDAVEANPETMKLLKANVLLNECQNVKLHEFAAGDDAGQVNFLMSIENSGGSKIVPIRNKIQYSYDSPLKIAVQLKPLDDAFEGEFDVVMMDLEGSEVVAIRGAKKLLSQARVLICEYFPEHIDDVLATTDEEFVSTVRSCGFKHFYCRKMDKNGSLDELLPCLKVIRQIGSSEDGIVFTR